MDNERPANTDRVDILAKQIGSAVAVVTLVITLVNIGIAAKTNRDAEQRELNQKFREEQLKRYLDISETLSKIAILSKDQSAERKNAYFTFLEHFWGDIGVVEAKEVKEPLEIIWLQLEDFDLPGHNYTMNDEQRARLMQMSHELSKVMRDDIIRLWHIDLPGSTDVWPEQHNKFPTWKKDLVDKSQRLMEESLSNEQ